MANNTVKGKGRKQAELPNATMKERFKQERMLGRLVILQLEAARRIRDQRSHLQQETDGALR